MWLQSIKFIVKKSKCPGLAWEIGFSALNLWSLPWLVSCNTVVHLQKGKKLDLNAAQYFWLVDQNDWSRWFAISSYHVYAISVTIFIGGVARKRKKAILRHLILFSRVTYWAPLVEMLLLHTSQNEILDPPEAHTSIKNPIPVPAWYENKIKSDTRKGW
jgi:hypothetical protein